MYPGAANRPWPPQLEADMEALKVAVLLKGKIIFTCAVSVVIAVSAVLLEAKFI